MATERPPLEVRVTRHLRGGYVPGYWYEADPDDPYVKELIADGLMIRRDTDAHLAPRAAQAEPELELGREGDGEDAPAPEEEP